MFGESKGIILYSRDHKEKDKLVKIFTEKYGKLVFYVKNAHRKNNPLGASILPMTAAVYSGEIKSEGLSFLNAAKDIQPYAHLQQDIFANAYATYVLGLADAAIEDKKADPFLFRFCQIILAQMDLGNDPEVLTNIFEVQVLGRFGVSLELDKCALCGNTKGPFDFSEKFHGLLCRRHFSEDERRLHTDPKVCYLLQVFNQLPPQRIGKISVSPATKEQLRAVLDEIYDEYVGVHLKSKHFIAEMKKWQQLMQD
ncbi:DNA repair protein RecO [Enterococcus nangangensis]|uniref:DNA repair protein RecO n=1 Tax=Enterococcus nangangensis TaxID=2559926 RepID=UPI0010FA0A09|nr:DNA repair protein RecO [Enterococcus nangangensis]